MAAQAPRSAAGAAVAAALSECQAAVRAAEEAALEVAGPEAARVANQRGAGSETS